MIRAVAALLLACALALPAAAADKPQYPQFMSLRSNEVNLRAGPGEKYPIHWVYRRKGLPVEVIDSYDVWRHVRDWQGTEGWIQVRLLSATRTVIIKADTRTIYQEPARDSPALAKLEPGVIATLLECRNAWCRVETRGRRVVRGWLLRSEIWGVTPDETIE
ncbi:MAG TPA: SH3 domain-containing protein [Stellaceae bacterium]|nr:SH3 domain-containing protein [Stellaceae bacterium]